MTHKKLISLLVLLTVAISGAWADDTKTLTVHDGFSTNSFVPFWGKLVNKYTRSEMIYPATELAGMKGGDIKSLTFYKSGFSDTGSWGTAYFQIYLKEVSSTALSAYIGMTDATVVYQGGVGIADGERPVTIEFDTPYHYNGGNLLVGIYQTGMGSSSNAYFYGEEVTGASSSGSNNSAPANADFKQRDFLPKTTFTYKPAPPDYAFSVADSEHGSGTVSFTVQDKDDAENVKQNATRANEGDLVTMTITPDASWVVDAENVKAQTYTTWGAAGAPRRIAANNIQILGDVTFTSTSYNETTGVYTCTFTMPSANVLVSAAYKKMGTLYFDPADKTDLMEVKVGDEVKAPANGRLRRILEGTAVKLTANKGYQLRKVVVKKNVPIALNINNPAVGQYIGTDGKNYAYASLPPGVSTIAKICYVNGNHGLALALEDEGQMDWNTAITEAADHTPKVIGGTWKLASKDEWQQMINAADNFENLADGFTSVGGTNMSWGDYVFYWLNTERSDDDAYIYEYYEDYSFQMISYFGSGDKNKNYIVRACLEF